MDVVLQLVQVAPFATAMVAALTFWKGMQTQRSMKQQDVMANFQRRYEEIRYDLLLKAQKGEYPADLFYLRFWNLQIDQFKAWQLGFIPDDVYLDHWLSERRAECAIAPVQGVSWVAGWEQAKATLGHKQFCAFMDQVLNSSVERAVAGLRRK